MYVYVLDRNGVPLMPTSRCGRVRILLKQGKAKVVKRTPFTIKLLYESTSYKQPVVLGIDAGSKTIGVSATTEKQELYAAEVKPRNDITKNLDSRRDFRRARRFRKKRYRKAKFDNRVKSKHKGWLAPSIESKIHTHLRIIDLVAKILPIQKVVIETAEFDIHKLKNPKVSGIEYQLGEKYGEQNTRQYILHRDNYTCRCCGSKEGVLYVVPAERKATIAPEDLYTVCRKCFVHHGKTHEPYKFRKKRYFAHPTFMGIMRKTLIARAKEMFPNLQIEETDGYITKGIREQYNISKSHIADARCISGNPLAKALSYKFLYKAVRTRNRQIHKATISKGGYRKPNQLPKYVFGFQLFDKVRYKGKVGFIFARRKSGSFRVKTLNGDVLSTGVTYKKLKLLEKRRSLLCEIIS